jgi:hypothetical protein
MNPASRTPEGEPNCCPICGKEVRLEPSQPPGDAPCPNCGHLLWFPSTEPRAARLGQKDSRPKSVTVCREMFDQVAEKYLREKVADDEVDDAVLSGAPAGRKRWWQIWRK